MKEAFIIYNENNIEQVSTNFKVPELDSKVVTLSIASAAGTRFSVSNAFNPLSTTSGFMYGYVAGIGSSEFVSFLAEKKHPMFWVNSTENSVFSVQNIDLLTDNTVDANVIISGNVTFKFRCTSLTEGTYSINNYLNMFNEASELSWSVNKVVNSPKILGRLVIPATSLNNVDTTGFVALPSGTDLTRVYVLLNLSHGENGWEGDDDDEYWATGISYSITSTGVYGRFFSKGYTGSKALEDTTVLIGYI